MAVDSFGVNGDATLAQTRWRGLGEDASRLFGAIQTNPNGAKTEAITGFAAVVNATSGGEVSAPEPESSEEPATLLPGCGGEDYTLLTEPQEIQAFYLLLLVYSSCSLLSFSSRWRIFSSKGAGNCQTFQPKPQATPFEPPVAEVASDKGAEYFRPANEAPVSQFMTTYMQGEDQYDDSFSIDNPVGEFLGECGVGITESIGVGDPKKAAAFEVWLFDKNDIQTVTKVLMSDHVFKDPGMHQKLLSKGEPILAEPGKRILLETATLQLEARIVDMSYGQGPLPPNSYFERLTLELAVWPKNK